MRSPVARSRSARSRVASSVIIGVSALYQKLQIVTLNRLAPRNVLEPGSILINEDGQGLTRVGTAGALCRDGERYYVLTNQHVGRDDGPIQIACKPDFSRLNNDEIELLQDLILKTQPAPRD